MQLAKSVRKFHYKSQGPFQARGKDGGEWQGWLRDLSPSHNVQGSRQDVQTNAFATHL